MSRIHVRACTCPCYGLPLIARKTARLRARLVPMAAGLTCAAGGFLTRYVQRRPIVAHAQICASLFSLVDFMAIEWKCNHFSLNQPPIPWKGGGKTNIGLGLYFQNFFYLFLPWRARFLLRPLFHLLFIDMAGIARSRQGRRKASFSRGVEPRGRQQQHTIGASRVSPSQHEWGAW